MIDVVVLWVDPTDSRWLSTYKEHSGSDLDVATLGNRFRDWGTLKYVFRCIDKNLPWVRKIHIITEGHLPSWLDLDNERVVHHTHSNLFKYGEALPSFNSSAIELNFDEIDGLSDKFLYFNDDFLVLKETGSERFFKEELPVDYFRLCWPRNNFIYRFIRKESAWQSMIFNNLNLINDSFDFKKAKEFVSLNTCINFQETLKQKILLNFNRVPYIEHYHHVQPFRKASIIEVNSQFEPDVKLTIFSKFRKKYNISQALYRYFQLVTGKFHSEDYRDHKVYSLTSLEDVLNIDLIGDGYNLVCLNDVFKGSSEDYLQAQSILEDKLLELFPNKSEFEN